MRRHVAGEMHPKKAFGWLLHEYAKANNRTFEEIAKKAGVSPSYISKWKGGKWDQIGTDLLVKVVTACTSDPGEQVDLIGAYLQDMTPPQFVGRIRFDRAGEAESEALAGNWNAPMRRRLEAMAKASGKHDEFRKMFDTMGNWAENINRE